MASGVGYGAEGTEFPGSSAAIPTTCSTDGQIDCVTTVAFKAANLVSAAKQAPFRNYPSGCSW